MAHKYIREGKGLGIFGMGNFMGFESCDQHTWQDYVWYLAYTIIAYP